MGSSDKGSTSGRGFFLKPPTLDFPNFRPWWPCVAENGAGVGPARGPAFGRLGGGPVRTELRHFEACETCAAQRPCRSSQEQARERKELGLSESRAGRAATVVLVSSRRTNGAQLFRRECSMPWTQLRVAVGGGLRIAGFLRSPRPEAVQTTVGCCAGSARAHF